MRTTNLLSKHTGADIFSIVYVLIDDYSCRFGVVSADEHDVTVARVLLEIE